MLFKTVHADTDIVRQKNTRELWTGKLSLVGVEDFRRSIPLQCFGERFSAKRTVHAVGQVPGKNVATIPVYNCCQVQKASKTRVCEKNRS